MYRYFDELVLFQDLFCYFDQFVKFHFLKKTLKFGGSLVTRSPNETKMMIVFKHILINSTFRKSENLVILKVSNW